MGMSERMLANRDEKRVDVAWEGWRGERVCVREREGDKASETEKQSEFVSVLCVCDLTGIDDMCTWMFYVPWVARLAATEAHRAECGALGVVATVADVVGGLL